MAGATKHCSRARRIRSSGSRDSTRSPRKSGETISFKSETPFSFDRIEIQALRQPKGGTIEIRLDGVFQSVVNFPATRASRW
jgi:hypothetical protein